MPKTPTEPWSGSTALALEMLPVGTAVLLLASVVPDGRPERAVLKGEVHYYAHAFE